MLKLVAEDELHTAEAITDVPPIPLHELLKICSSMERLCVESNGIGLAAVQVGLPWKLFVVKGAGCPLIATGTFGYFVNCEYEPTNDSQRVVSLEGCLSLRSQDGRLRTFQVERMDRIRLHGTCVAVKGNKYELEKIECELDLAGQSVVFQHEIDHHNGLTIRDKGQEVFVW